MPTPGSVPEAENVAPLDDALALPRPVSPAEPDPVARLLHAAEALAHARASVSVYRVLGADHRRVREVAFCRECQRQDALNAAAHTESCAVGQVLAAVAAVRAAAADGVALIAAERKRQVESEGWTPEHDDDHVMGEMIGAAITYAGHTLTAVSDNEIDADGLEFWPWADEWWKPSPDPVRNLVKAGALIAAEIDRLKRLPAPIPAAEVIESDESWEAAAALHRPTASWDHGDFASATSGLPERRVVCGRAIAVSGFPGLDTFTCDLERGHGDAWHHDRTVNKIWLAEATEIYFHLNGMVETRLMGRSPEFDYSAVTAVPR